VDRGQIVLRTYLERCSELDRAPDAAVVNPLVEALQAAGVEFTDDDEG
jgi:hypothetical protein